MMPPVIQSIPAKDFYGLHTKSPTVGNKIKGNRDNKSSRQEEAAQNILRGGRKSSEEASLKPETMCSSKKPAGHESLCTSSQVCNNIDEDPSQTVFGDSAIKTDMPVTCDVTRRANKATKKARPRAANYRPEKLLLAQTMPEKQVTFEKDPTDSMQLLTKSPPQSLIRYEQKRLSF
jgi:hypothetical protein